MPFQDELVGRPGGWRSGFCIARHEPKSLIISRAIIGGTKYNTQTYPLQITHRFRLLSAPDFVHILVCAHISIYLKLKTIKIDVKSNYVGTDLFSWEDDTIVFGLEPFHGVGFSQFVLKTDL